MNRYELLQTMMNYDSVYIYGMGDYSKTLTLAFEKLGVLDYIDGYVVSNKERKRMLGKKVFSIEEINIKHNAIEENVLFFLAMSEEKHEDVKKRIHKNWPMIPINYNGFVTLKNYLSIVDKNQMQVYVKEILDTMNMRSVIEESMWISQKDLYPGEMAVNSKYLFLLYHMLNSDKFKSILDIGLGQTSRLIGQYACYMKDITHHIIEADIEWMDFFLDKYENELKHSQIVSLNYEYSEFNGFDNIRTISNFKETLLDKKYNIISIDAPFSGDMSRYARIDLIDLLPNCLDDSWIILIDDTNRVADSNSLKAMKEVLIKNGMTFTEKYYTCYNKQFSILSSLDNQFLLSI